MDIDSIKEIKEKKDDVVTAAEHTDIILRYLQTGQLNRNDAIKKYKKFNDDHPDYYVAMRTVTVAAGTAAHIEDERIPDSVIVGNLNQQLLWLTGKNLLESSPQNRRTN